MGNKYTVDKITAIKYYSGNLWELPMKNAIENFTDVLDCNKEVLKTLHKELYAPMIKVGLMLDAQAGELPMHHTTATNQEELSDQITPLLEEISQKTHEFLKSKGNEQHRHLVEAYLNEIDHALAEPNEQLAKPHKK